MLTHIVIACSISAKSQYRKRHDKARTYVHWLPRRKYHLQCNDNWYTHKPKSVQENGEYKIFWDFNIQTDKVIEAGDQTQFVSTSKRERECQISDFAIPGGKNIAIKEQKKNGKVPELKNRITENLKCQDSGHTGSYRCSRNYVEENTALYKRD